VHLQILNRQLFNKLLNRHHETLNPQDRPQRVSPRSRFATGHDGHKGVDARGARFSQTTFVNFVMPELRGFKGFVTFVSAKPSW
jgi:hypothetical protein